MIDRDYEINIELCGVPLRVVYDTESYDQPLLISVFVGQQDIMELVEYAPKLEDLVYNAVLDKLAKEKADDEMHSLFLEAEDRRYYAEQAIM